MSDKHAARIIDVAYPIDDDGVGAKVSAVPAWTLIGSSVEEVRALVVDGVEFATGDGSPFELHETIGDLRRATAYQVGRA